MAVARELIGGVQSQVRAPIAWADYSAIRVCKARGRDAHLLSAPRAVYAYSAPPPPREIPPGERSQRILRALRYLCDMASAHATMPALANSAVHSLRRGQISRSRVERTPASRHTGLLGTRVQENDRRPAFESRSLDVAVERLGQ